MNTCVLREELIDGGNSKKIAINSTKLLNIMQDDPLQRDRARAYLHERLGEFIVENRVRNSERTLVVKIASNSDLINPRTPRHQQNIYSSVTADHASKYDRVRINPISALLYLAAMGGSGYLGIEMGPKIAESLLSDPKSSSEKAERVFTVQPEDTQKQRTWQQVNKAIEEASAYYPAVIPLRNGMLDEKHECSDSPANCFPQADDGKTIITYTVAGATATHVPEFAVAVRDALQKIEGKTSIRFVPVSHESEARHIFGIADNSGDNALARAPYPSRDRRQQHITINKFRWPQGRTPMNRVHVILHEEGHALGLPHITGHPESMMNSKYVPWTESDIAEAKRKQETLPPEGSAVSDTPSDQTPEFPATDAAAVRAMYGCDGREIGCNGQRKPVKDSTTYERDNAGRWRAQVEAGRSRGNPKQVRGFQPPTRQ